MLPSSSSSWESRTPSAVVPASESLRADGNELYRSGKLIQGKCRVSIMLNRACGRGSLLILILATKKYLEAIALSPDDPAPLRTLSAARFELGDYSGCIEAIRNALPLEDDTSKMQVLQVREVKCLLHLRRYEEAVAAAEKLDGGVELKRVVEAARYYQKRDPFSTEEKRRELHDRADTPIYRPNL
jgi:tetratricopeptide (TPR) repeat protein